MFSSRPFRLFVINAILFLAIGFHAETNFAQHPCDNYPVVQCNVPTSFSTWTIQDNNSTATGQINEPTGDANAAPLNTLWYSWTAPITGIFVTNTRGTNPNQMYVFDTVIAVYRATGSGTIDTLHQIVANDDWTNNSICSANLQAPRPPDELQNSSCVLFLATAGVKYYFQVDGYANLTGPFLLNGYYLSPTSADASITGRVTDVDGNGISRAIVSITLPNGETRSTLANQFGYYKFDDLEAGQSYVLRVQRKGMSFQNNPRVVSLNEDLTIEDFVADVGGV